jgi:hypothetical protein
MISHMPAPPFHPLTEDQLAQIGLIAVESARVEDLVDFMVAKLFGLSRDKLRLLMPTTMLAGKLDVFGEIGVLKLKSAKKKNEFKKILAQLKHFNSQRVVAIHGQWQFNLEGSMSLAQFVKQGGVKLERGDAKATHIKGRGTSSTLRADELENTAKEIARYHAKLWHFCLDAWLGPRYLKKAQRAAKSPPKSL